MEVAQGERRERFGAGQDLIANPRVQELRRHHVDRPSLQEPGELTLDSDEVETGDVARLEIHQDVDVAFRPKIVAEHRAEES